MSSEAGPLNTSIHLREAFMNCVRKTYLDKTAILGQGSFGTVLKVQLPTANQDPKLSTLLESAGLAHLAGDTVAVKTQVAGRSESGSVLTEGRKMRALQSSPHVVRVYGEVSGVVKDADGREVKLDCLVLEYAEQGTISSWGEKMMRRPAGLSSSQLILLRKRHCFSFLDSNQENGEHNLLAFLSGLVGLLVYLDLKRTAHSDLKPDNLLVDGAGCLKCADWGTSGPMGEVPAGSSPPYLPPEDPWGESVAVGGQRDVWAAGVTAGKLIVPGIARTTNVGHSMGDHDCGVEGFWREVLCDRANGNHEVLKDHPLVENLLRQMLEMDRKKRIGAIEAMSHPYFVQYCGGDIKGFWRRVLEGKGPCLIGI
jgi:serine/threonine protein kinase